ncbi:MAG TPA: DUF3592 domain-containing protein [Trebonia sp.]
MAVVIGVWMALAGALALLVGASARRRVRRLKRDGIKVWAEAIHRPPPDGEQVTLQYTLTDGRVLERSARTRRGAPLASGEKVLIWYDPHDPAEVVISGRDGRASDLAFVVIGLIFLLAGAGIAIGG